MVFGFPLFTALALHSLSSAHGAVIVGLLPAATAVAAVLFAGERPTGAFWAASGAGLVAVLVFAGAQGAGLPSAADGLVLIAVAFGALGYAEGGALSRELGGWQTICWALVLSLPLTVPVTLVAVAPATPSGGADAWAGFAYVSLVSMFLGFFAWYAGPGARRHRPDRPDAAGPAGADAGVGGAAARRARDPGHGRGFADRAGLRGGDAAHARRSRPAGPSVASAR